MLSKQSNVSRAACRSSAATTSRYTRFPIRIFRRTRFSQGLGRLGALILMGSARPSGAKGFSGWVPRRRNLVMAVARSLEPGLLNV